MKKLTPEQLTQNPFSLIDKQWMLITTRAGEKTNAMTASWGGVGILWNKPVAYLFVRPQRFTCELLSQSELLSVGFLPEAYRKELTYCGRNSGRDGDKLAVCGLTTIELDGAPVVAQSELALTCRKLYCQRMTPESFIDTGLDAQNYPGKDYHYFYVVQILGAYTDL